MIYIPPRFLDPSLRPLFRTQKKIIHMDHRTARLPLKTGGKCCLSRRTSSVYSHQHSFSAALVYFF